MACAVEQPGHFRGTIFLSDALALLAVILWLTVKISNMSLRGPCSFARSNILAKVDIASSHTILRSVQGKMLLAMTCLLLSLSSLSVLWSTDWRTSIYFSLHLWLVFLFILSLRDWRAAWKPAMLGFCAALSFQVITGIVEFATQSTGFLNPLRLNWPGPFNPSIHGVSVVQLTDGLRILRAYGTTPHPNILGGFALISLLGPASLFLVNKKPNYPALILFSLGITLMALTFSRSAWLGLIVFLLLLILKSKHLERKRLFLLLATSLMTIILTLYPLRELVFTRISNAPVETEQLSTFERSWLNQQALDMIRQHPLTGVGIGSFILELATYGLPGASIEPVHNIFLLAGAELGIFGLILVSGLFISIVLNIIKAQTPKSILASSLLAGLGIINLFDHYFWSLAPGRLMLALALGLWAGSIKTTYSRLDGSSIMQKID